jgi:hypothetical protein
MMPPWLELRRGRVQCGETHVVAKLREVDVIEIRRLLVDSDLGYKEIGKMFGVSGRAISSIAYKETRAWL